MTDDIERTVNIPKWDYLTITLNMGDLIDKGARHLGQDGWELVSLDWDTGRAVFKRVAGLIEVRA